VIGHVKMRNPATGATRVVLGSYMEGDARIGWRVQDGTTLSLIGQNLFHQNHQEVNDPSAYPAHYIPRSIMLNLRQSL
jgi:hypothetical protein